MKDYLGFNGKKCVVIGAASGVGKAITEALVDVGAIVYALDRNPVEVEGIHEYIHIDLLCKKSIDDVFRNKLPHSFDQFYGIAAVSGETTCNKDTITINFVSYQYIIREYIPTRLHDHSEMLICSSVGANRWYDEVNRGELEALVHAKDWEDAMRLLDIICTDDLPVGQAYTFSKRALAYFTMETAYAFAPRHIRVNSLKVGNVKTGLMEEFRTRFKRLHPGATDEDYDKANGLDGMAESYQMAEPALFLCSNMASYITGVELLVDSGKECGVILGKEEDCWTRRLLTIPVDAIC
jgi:NAD(P)-dependent dehydrogenase (short-subunit alcohol dehydrogenase family)